MTQKLKIFVIILHKQCIKRWKKIIFSYILFFNHEVISCERQFFWYIFLKPIFALINQNSNSFHEGFIQINIFYHLLHARPSILDDEDLWGVCVAKKSMRDFAIHTCNFFRSRFIPLHTLCRERELPFSLAIAWLMNKLEFLWTLSSSYNFTFVTNNQQDLSLAQFNACSSYSKAWTWRVLFGVLILIWWF